MIDSRTNRNLFLVWALLASTAGNAYAQGPPGGGGRPDGGGGGGRPGGGRPPRGNGTRPEICPDEGGFAGLEEYMGAGPYAAPLLGNIGCVDNPINVTNRRGEYIEFAKDIYGPFEAGFRASQIPCDNPQNKTVIGGLDTQAAAGIMNIYCERTDIVLLSPCGGHANYHFHERMGCLYESDEVTGHSTRIGVALDGNGIYGMYVDGGVLPTDLDACGGRFGVTPDSNGMEVYYYPMKNEAPFTMACFGPAETLQECRDLYERCGDDVTEIETLDGIVEYDLWCPCFDSNGNNVMKTMEDPVTEVDPEEEETSTFMHIMAPNVDGNACIAVRGELAYPGQTLVLAECSDSTTAGDGWKFDMDAGGLVHSQLEESFCMQAGLDGPPQEGGYIRLLPCDDENGYQKFVHDTPTSMMNGNGHATLRPLANQNLCLSWSGQNPNVGSDLIIMKQCSEVQSRSGWQVLQK